uniref:Uncharacterized protein n=1 Tax=Arundo donax TaxID=35708 RepID=A0A0A9EKQ6_ARUDO
MGLELFLWPRNCCYFLCARNIHLSRHAVFEWSRQSLRSKKNKDNIHGYICTDFASCTLKNSQM